MKLLKEMWCRILHGHVMVCYGKEKEGSWYMCARCLRCELLETISGKEFE